MLSNLSVSLSFSLCFHSWSFSVTSRPVKEPDPMDNSMPLVAHLTITLDLAHFFFQQVFLQAIVVIRRSFFFIS